MTDAQAVRQLARQSEELSAPLVFARQSKIFAGQSAGMAGIRTNMTSDHLLTIAAFLAMRQALATFQTYQSGFRASSSNNLRLEMSNDTSTKRPHHGTT